LKVLGRCQHVVQKEVKRGRLARLYFPQPRTQARALRSGFSGANQGVWSSTGIGDSRLKLRNIHDREHHAEEAVRVVPQRAVELGQTTTSKSPLGDRAPPSGNALRSVVVANSRTAPNAITAAQGPQDQASSRYALIGRNGDASRHPRFGYLKAQFRPSHFRVSNRRKLSRAFRSSDGR
jgi:hypothetical protein